MRFADAVEATLLELARSPGLGPKIATANSRLTGLRKWRISQFRRYLLFYHAGPDEIVVVRCFHASQDWWAILDVKE